MSGSDGQTAGLVIDVLKDDLPPKKGEGVKIALYLRLSTDKQETENKALGRPKRLNDRREPPRPERRLLLCFRDVRHPDDLRQAFRTRMPSLRTTRGPESLTLAFFAAQAAIDEKHINIRVLLQFGQTIGFGRRVSKQITAV